MYHNLINHVDVLSAHNVRAIVNRIKIGILRMDVERETGKFAGDYFRENLWIILSDNGIFTPDTGQIYIPPTV